MTNSLNFKTAKKTFLTVTLIDGTVLLIGTPTKRVFDALTTIQNGLKADVSDIDDNTLDEIYEACAYAMSRNKAGKVITKEYLEEIFDIEDILLFFNAYVNFIETLTDQKN